VPADPGYRGLQVYTKAWSIHGGIEGALQRPCRNVPYGLYSTLGQFARMA